MNDVGSHEYADTGYGPIDMEHRGLTTTMNRVLFALNHEDVQGARALLSRMQVEVVVHFSHEETMMKKTGYALLARHKAAHDNFLTDLDKHLQDLKKNGLTVDFRKWAVGRLVDWWRFHIMANDVALGLFLLKRAAEAGHPNDAWPAQAVSFPDSARE